MDIDSTTKYTNYLVSQQTISFDETFKTFGDIGLFITLVVVLTFAFIGFAPSSMLVLAITGLTFMVLLGFVAGTVPVLIVLGMLFLFMIYRMNV